MFIHSLSNWSFGLSYVLEATFSGGYLSLLVDCLSDDGEPVLFLLVLWWVPCQPLSTYLKLLVGFAKVSLLILLAGIGVPVVGVLKAVPLSTIGG